MAKGNLVEAFMRATGRFRAVLGPASRTPLGDEMTEQNKALLVQRQAETRQWETLRRPDGSTYVVPRDPEDKSLR